MQHKGKPQESHQDLRRKELMINPVFDVKMTFQLQPFFPELLVRNKRNISKIKKI
jgi:hypothetical protein